MRTFLDLVDFGSEQKWNSGTYRVWQVIFFSWLVCAAFLLPLVQDEAYYAAWHSFLDWGYLDHPPGVAVLAALGQSFSKFFGGNCRILVRLGTLLIALLQWREFKKLLQAIGYSDSRSLTLGFLLMQGNLAAMISGFVTTPDNVLVLCWTAALRQAYLALNGNRNRWVYCGVAIGVGLLSKYTMILMGPICLIGLITKDFQGLKTRWPYCGALMAMAIFLPNVLWNSQNNWATFEFQLRHGLGAPRAGTNIAVLPKPEFAPRVGAEFLLAKKADDYVRELLPAKIEKAKKKKREPQGIGTMVFLRARDFLLSQLFLWGALVLPLVAALVSRIRKRRTAATVPVDCNQGILHTDYQGGDSCRIESGPMSGNSLLWAAVWFPILFFLLFALKSKVEANWSAMYLIAAAALAIPILKEVRRWVVVGAVLNLILILLIVVHANIPFLPIKPEGDRILKESHGYEGLSQHVAASSEIVLADSYQIVSMLRFYEPNLRVFQWPGITRPSEWTRRDSLLISKAEYDSTHELRLVTTDAIPSHFPGWELKSIDRIRDCKRPGLDIVQIDVQKAEQVSSAPFCENPIHEWQIYRYRRGA